MKIGFFGDSYCADFESDEKWKTYIQLLSDYFKADITHLGYAGSNIFDCIEKQFFSDFEESDILIFCWTGYGRLYHDIVRHLTVFTTESRWYDKDKNVKIYDAAKTYYEHLYNDRKHLIEACSMMHWFDDVVLSKINKKIIHMFSVYDYSKHDEFIPFKNGKTIPKVLSDITSNKLKHRKAKNHIYGDENIKIFNVIKSYIEDKKVIL